MISGTPITTAASSNHAPRKIRSDAKLERLTDDQRASVRRWLEDEFYSYRDAAVKISREFGVSVSKSALCAYYLRHLLTERHRDRTEDAAELAALPASTFDAATINHAKALAFDALVNPAPQLDLAARLLDLVRRAEKQEIARERLALEKERVALRREELLARPPRQPRATNPELCAATPNRPPRSSVSPSPEPSAPPAPEPAFNPPGLTPLATATASMPALPPPSCVSLASPLPLLSPATHDSSLPSSSFVQAHSAPPPSQKIPPTPPAFPASSNLVQLTDPLQPASSQTVLRPSPPAESSTLHAPIYSSCSHHPIPVSVRPSQYPKPT